MPRKLRTPKLRRDPGTIRPAVLHYLETGAIVLAPSDNVWLRLSLMDRAAREARTLWLDGDDQGARAALARCPGLSGWYVQ